MKALFIAAAIFIVSSCGSDEVTVGNKTTMEVNDTFHAGRILKGEKINAKFTVKNTGTYPLVIADVKVACSCTLASKPEEPIAPGESAVIEAVVDTEKTGAGAITKAVTIVSNTTPSTRDVLIKATVMNN